jgi:hypothetical protein
MVDLSISSKAWHERVLGHDETHPLTAGEGPRPGRPGANG